MGEEAKEIWYECKTAYLEVPSFSTQESATQLRHHLIEAKVTLLLHLRVFQV